MMKIWLLIVVLLIGVLIFPISVAAQPPPSSADVVITASGYVVEAPGGLTLTYISDYEIGVSWTKGSGANITMVRAAYDRSVENRDDGYLVYSGNGTSTTMWISNVGFLGSINLRAWSQRGDGMWEELGTTAEGNFMSMSFLFGILVALGLGLFIAAFRWKDMLLSYSAALTWMAIGFWWILGDISNFGLGDPWVQILVFIPFILAFTVLLRLMNTEISMEAKGKKWSEWGATPKEESPSRRTEYRNELRNRIGRK